MVAWTGHLLKSQKRAGGQTSAASLNRSSSPQQTPRQHRLHVTSPIGD